MVHSSSVMFVGLVVMLGWQKDRTQEVVGIEMFGKLAQVWRRSARVLAWMSSTMAVRLREMKKHYSLVSLSPSLTVSAKHFQAEEI